MAGLNLMVANVGHKISKSKYIAVRLLISVHLRPYTDDVGIRACTNPIVGPQSVIVGRLRT